MSGETALLSAILDTLRRVPGIRVMRNAVGSAKKGKAYVKFGLGTGSPDIVGFTTTGARFIGLEVKAPDGVVSAEQVQWLADLRASGGFGAVVRSVDEAVKAVERAKGGECE